MKITIVHPSLAIKGGAENLMVWMAQGFAARGHSVKLVTTDYSAGLWDSFLEKNVAVTHLRPRFFSQVMNSKRLTILDYGGQLCDILRDQDVIFCSLFPTHLWVARAKKSSRLKGRVIWYLQEPSRRTYWQITDRHVLEHAKYCQGSEYNVHLRKCIESRLKSENKHKKQRQMLWDKHAVRHIDLVLANSRFSADNIARAFGASVEVCYPGIPTCFGAEAEQPGEYLLAVAPLRAKKNVHNVVEALHLLSTERNRKDIRLKIVGQGPSRSELEQLVRKRGISSQVEFLGFLDDQQLADVYRGARLTVYIPIDEPFGLIAVESMFHGVPPIVSDHGGVSEIVRDGQTGMLVNPFDPRAVADTIESLWGNSARIHEMGAAGRQQVEAKFTQRHFLDRLEAFLV